MQNKILKLFVIFVVLFSLQGFSQTTETSKHPLLDKYYPQPKNADTSTITQTKPIAETKRVSALMDTTTIHKSTNTTVPISETKLISAATPVPPVKDSIAINKPANPAVPASIPKKVQANPSSSPYGETRLGSSSPLYNTYEKNKNGVGSVTTNPKG